MIDIITSIDPSVNARHVLAYILTEHQTTNHLSIEDIKNEIQLFRSQYHPEDEWIWEQLANQENL